MRFRGKSIFQRRLIIATVVIVLLKISLIAHLFVLQTQQRLLYATMADENRLRVSAVAPTRGLIYDRNGEPLARNQTVYRLEVRSAAVVDRDKLRTMLPKLIVLNDKQISLLERELSRHSSLKSVVVKDRLSNEEVAKFAVNRHHFIGAAVIGEPNRYYPHGEVFSHAIGYLSKLTSQDFRTVDARKYRHSGHIGRTGIERRYEDVLYGEIGLDTIEVNAEGRTLRTVRRRSPIAGSDVMLTLDKNLQELAYQAMGDMVGAVVALDPRNGEVLALVSKPAFDPNQLFQGISAQAYQAMLNQPDRPFFNRAISGQYPPGSTIKPVVALAGLHYGVTSAHYQMYAGPNFALPGSKRRFRDWRKQGHGWVDLQDSIAQSCDVFFYDLSHRIGIDRLQETFRQFGLGNATDIDLPNEQRGLVPSREWKRRTHRLPWYPEETIISGIGQGYLLATPLQLAVMTATIATRGIQSQPQMVRAVRTAGQVEWRLKELIVKNRLHFSSAHWKSIVDGMIDAVHRPNGTAYSIGHDAPYMMAGKTGTVQLYQLSQDEEYDKQAIDKSLRDHALFVVFAPVQDPTIVVAVVGENAGSGSRSAAPVARSVLDAYFGAVHSADRGKGQSAG